MFQNYVIGLHRRAWLFCSVEGQTNSEIVCGEAIVVCHRSLAESGMMIVHARSRQRAMLESRLIRSLEGLEVLTKPQSYEVMLHCVLCVSPFLSVFSCVYSTCILYLISVCMY